MMKFSKSASSIFVAFSGRRWNRQAHQRHSRVILYRRLTIAILLLAALSCAGLAYTSVTPLGAGASTPPSTSVGVLSAQRVPALLAGAAFDATIRADVSATSTTKAGQNCIAVNRDGQTIVDTGHSQAYIPASTLKLLTTTAALDLLGAKAQFTTSVKAANVGSDGVIDGPLYLVGGGDPLLFTNDYVKALNRPTEMHTSLETLADQVKAKGIKVVHGSVVGDDSLFDKTRYLSSWDPAYQAQGQIGPTGALQVNQGFQSFVGGRVPAPDPTLQAVSQFTALLKQRGITVDGPPSSGDAPDKAGNVTSIDSPPLSAIVAEMLTESDNSTAEMLLRDIGVKASGTGTFAAGVAAVNQQIKKDGIPTAGLNMVDGSGLSRNDRVTCSSLLAALVHDGPNGTIATGLPKAGQTGTLADRMTNSIAVGKVSAKTGTLAGVSALAGWVHSGTADPFAFVVINNGVSGDQGRNFEDGLAESFAGLPPPAPVSTYIS
jgi:serine-type D-Ala-D-Ala carboxypeptidase/endopeptidase (penicillin-binding protein 4)